MRWEAYRHSPSALTTPAGAEDTPISAQCTWPGARSMSLHAQPMLFFVEVRASSTPFGQSPPHLGEARGRNCIFTSTISSTSHHPPTYTGSMLSRSFQPQRSRTRFDSMSVSMSTCLYHLFFWFSGLQYGVRRLPVGSRMDSFNRKEYCLTSFTHHARAFSFSTLMAIVPAIHLSLLSLSSLQSVACVSISHSIIAPCSGLARICGVCFCILCQPRCPVWAALFNLLANTAGTQTFSETSPTRFTLLAYSVGRGPSLHCPRTAHALP